MCSAQKHPSIIDDTDHGYSLVELVVVIALLAVLAAIALPRFADLRDEAQISSIRSMEGVMRSASVLVHSKARSTQNLSGAATLSLDGATSIPIHSGYAVAHWNRALRFMLNLDTQGFSGGGNQACERDWCGRGFQRRIPTDNGTIVTSGRAAKFWPRGYSWNDLCGVHYVNHEDGRPPEIGVSLSEC